MDWAVTYRYLPTLHFKTKYYFVEHYILLLFGVAVLTACNNRSAPAVDLAKEQQDLLNTDKDFSNTVGKQGMVKAMEKFYDDDVIGIIPNMPVEVGKASILKNFKDMKMDSVNGLSWVAEKGVVAAAGDLGYVWGHYQLKTKTRAGVDTVYYGAYCTIYKKEPNKSWKAIVDMNNDTPKP